MWFIKKKVCNHSRNVKHIKYHSPDGTPMIETVCLDCGYNDSGCVYTETWENEIIIVRNGKTVNQI